jgi:predicted AlkP superfamily phosphohydrolase/phosphomutase
VPMSSPAGMSSGVLVGGWTETGADDYTYPPELKGMLARAGYDPTGIKGRNARYYIAEQAATAEIASLLLRHLTWEHAFTVFVNGDAVAHRFGLYSPEWTRVYVAIDQLIGQLMKAAGEETTIMLVSDHGWRRFDRAVALDGWLNGSGFGEWTTILFAGNVGGVGPRSGPDLTRDLGIADAIAERLRGFPDPFTDQPVVARIRTAREVFTGPYTDESPALLFVELAGGYDVLPHDSLVHPSTVADHDMDGIYLITGPGVPAGMGPVAHVVDVAPTVLAFYGVPAVPDADGVPILDFGHPPGAQGIDRSRGTPQAEAAGNGRKEQRPARTLAPEVQERMRALGYMP